MKKHCFKSIYLIALCLAACLALAACDGLERSATVPPDLFNSGGASPSPDAGAAGPSSTQEGVITVLPAEDGALTDMQGVTRRDVIVCYPEGADEENAQFILRCALPVFSAEFPAYEAMNAAVDEYYEELLERVSAERLPFADGAADETPYTRVDCQLEKCGGYINVYLYETTSFGDGEELLPRVIVLGADGSRESLYSVTGLFDADAVAAQQVFNLIDANRSAYYGDITIEDVAPALDLYSAFFITQDGYALAIAPGVFAGEAEGALTFFIDREAFYPDVVGDVVTDAEYEALAAPINALAAACGMDYTGFADSSPSAFAASTFMTLMLGDPASDMLYTSVPAADYEAAWAQYFTSAIPSDLADSGDGTYSEDGVYMLPVYPRPTWSFRIDDAVRTESGLVLYGMLLYGVPGTSDAGELSAATLTLTSAPDSVMGYTFESLELR